MHFVLTPSLFCLLSYLSSPVTHDAKSANRMKNGATVGRRDRTIKHTVSTGCFCTAVVCICVYVTHTQKLTMTIKRKVLH